ncbi:hypothetical protein V6N13_077800 [Hibiscus sabdariffa]
MGHNSSHGNPVRALGDDDNVESWTYESPKNINAVCNISKSQDLGNLEITSDLPPPVDNPEDVTIFEENIDDIPMEVHNEDTVLANVIVQEIFTGLVALLCIGLDAAM